MIQRELKKHKCELCDYKSNQKSSLNRHKLIHDIQGIYKKYKCILCDYKTNEKGNLKRHQLTHEQDETSKK
ncbi:unnamed protein product [Callosobruchus maculatus]|uniref:C2H2-type domain-containing protein n=1 Tax=Callosobruchus maculatus TaxID=64391 RepID=A0A653BGE7_CALMS|nr:unnamed protein product [Callosobruchus maculatus]